MPEWTSAHVSTPKILASAKLSTVQCSKAQRERALPLSIMPGIITHERRKTERQIHRQDSMNEDKPGSNPFPRMSIPHFSSPSAFDHHTSQQSHHATKEIFPPPLCPSLIDPRALARIIRTTGHTVHSFPHETNDEHRIIRHLT